MCPTLLATTRMDNIYYGKGKSHAAPESLWETFYYQGLMDNVT